MSLGRGVKQGGFGKGSRPLNSYLTPTLLLLYSYPSRRALSIILPKVIVLLLILSFLALGCAPRTAIKPPPEPWDVVLTNDGERIECRILEMGFPDIKIHPKYGAFSYTILRTDVKQIIYGDGREEYYFHGVNMPPETAKAQMLKDREIAKRTRTTNRKYYAVTGMIGGFPVTCLIGVALFPWSVIVPPFQVITLLPMGIGTAIGYNYGKNKDIKEARKRELLKTKTDTLNIPGLRYLQK